MTPLPWRFVELEIDGIKYCQIIGSNDRVVMTGPSMNNKEDMELIVDCVNRG